MDMVSMRDMFFSMIDLNRDRKVCETDCFNVLRMLTKTGLQKSMFDDVQIIVNHLNAKRDKAGLSDGGKLMRD